MCAGCNYISGFPKKTVVVTITWVSRAKLFLEKPLKNTSIFVVRMTAFKGNIQKMVARTYPCICLCTYLCTHSHIHRCAYLCIDLCTYLCNYPCTHSCIYPCACPRNSREIASSVLYVVSYALFFGLGKAHMVGTCLVIAGYQLIIYRVFIGYMLSIR